MNSRKKEFDRQQKKALNEIMFNDIARERIWIKKKLTFDRKTSKANKFAIWIQCKYLPSLKYRLFMLRNEGGINFKSFNVPITFLPLFAFYIHTALWWRLEKSSERNKKSKENNLLLILIKLRFQNCNISHNLFPMSSLLSGGTWNGKNNTRTIVKEPAMRNAERE